VIDLSRMKGIRVDVAARTARVEGGCTWADLDHATHPFGLATPGGFISSTGVGGLTLGGGIGYLSRTFGLTSDTLLVDMVLADGSFVSASAEEHADLTGSMARSCRRYTRRCTSTRSTARPGASARTRPRSASATPASPR
jgi:FAD/FMN-containing dehydrogenase